MLSTFICLLDSIQSLEDDFPCDDYEKYIGEESYKMRLHCHSTKQHECPVYARLNYCDCIRPLIEELRWVNEWLKKIKTVITEAILDIAKSMLTPYFAEYHPISAQMSLSKNFGERLREDCQVVANTAKCSERRIGCDDHKVKTYTIKHIIHCVGEGLRNLVYKLCPLQYPPRYPLLCSTEI